MGCLIDLRSAAGLGMSPAEMTRKSHNWRSPQAGCSMEIEEMMRDRLTDVMKESLKAKDVRRTSTVRLIQTAIKDRDIANRGVGNH